MRRLKTFNPFLGNLLEIVPSHQDQNEYAIVFPMGELGRELSEDIHIHHVGLYTHIPLRHLSLWFRQVGKYGAQFHRVTILCV